MNITIIAPYAIRRLVEEALVSAIASLARKFGVEITVVYNE
jgi:hypothetical protein